MPHHGSWLISYICILPDNRTDDNSDILKRKWIENQSICCCRRQKTKLLQFRKKTILHSLKRTQKVFFLLISMFLAIKKRKLQNTISMSVSFVIKVEWNKTLLLTWLVFRIYGSIVVLGGVVEAVWTENWWNSYHISTRSSIRNMQISSVERTRKKSSRTA